MEDCLIMKVNTSSLSMEDVKSCFKTPEKKPITDLNLKNQPSKFFDSARVKEVKGIIHQILHKIKLFFGFIKYNWGESRQTAMKAILKSIRVELGKVVDDCKSNNKSLPEESITLYTNPQKTYAITLHNNLLQITRVALNKHALLEPIGEPIDLLTLPNMESCSVFIGELLKHHHSHIEETEITFIKPFVSNSKFRKIYDKGTGLPIRYELHIDDNISPVVIPLNANYDVNDKPDIISGNSKTHVILKPNGLVKKTNGMFNNENALRLNSFAKFIKTHTQNPDTKNASQIIVPVMGKSGILYMPKITKNPDLQLGKLHEYPDEELKLKVKVLYKNLLDEMQKIMSDNTYCINSQLEDAYSYQFSDFKLPQLVYGKKIADTEDNLYLVDNDLGVLALSLTLIHYPTTPIYSSEVFIDLVKNSDGEYKFEFSSDTEQFIAILISTVELYTGFKFGKIHGYTAYFISEFSADIFATQNNLKNGIYRTADDKYFQVIDSKINQLTLSVKSREISRSKKNKHLNNYIYDKLFKGGIVRDKSEHPIFLAKLKETIKPEKLVEVKELFEGLMNYDNAQGGVKNAHTKINKMMNKYFNTQAVEKLSDLFI